MTYRLPPLNATRAFEAAVRQGSVLAAARELQVTPGAVSRHIKLLETHLDCTLLIRAPRGVQATEKGRIYFEAAAKAFSGLDLAARSVSPETPPRTLVVQLYTSLMADWVGPRMRKFSSAYPGIDVQLIGSLETADLRAMSVDIAGTRDATEYPGIVKIKFLEEWFTPLCSPEFLAHCNGLHSPEDLHRFTVLTAATQGLFWDRWFNAVGVSTPVKASQSFERASLSYQAAREGAGVAIGNVVLLAGDIAAGKLVAPFPVACEILGPYWLAHRTQSAEEPALVTFRDWLLQEMSDHLAQYADLLGSFMRLSSAESYFPSR